MNEGAPKKENNVESFSGWQEKRDKGPVDAEALLEMEGLPFHEQSISRIEDKSILERINELVDNEETRLKKIFESSEASVEDKQAANQDKYKMRHLGYLREVAKVRKQQLELREVRTRAM